MKVELTVLDSPPLIVLMVSMDVKQPLKKKHLPRELSSCVKEMDVLIELPVHNSPYGLCGRKVTLELEAYFIVQASHQTRVRVHLKPVRSVQYSVVWKNF